MVAETTTGVFVGAEAAAEGGSLPEDVATAASHLLCEEIAKGGCIDTANQALVLLYMALSPEDVSKVRFGKLTPYSYVFPPLSRWLHRIILRKTLTTCLSLCVFSIQFLRHLRDFFGITFKIKPDHETKTVFLSCLGIGFTNMAKKVT